MLDFQRTRMSCVLLSGRGGLYNSRCAEHRRDRMEGFIALPSMSSLSEIRLDETTWEWPSDWLQPVLTAPRGMQSCYDEDHSSPR
jgi:hypothetical protein